GNVVNIHVQHPRERREDLEALVYYYLYDISEKYGMSVRYANKQLINELKAYRWAGNVSERMNVIEHHVILSNAETLNNEDIYQYLNEVGEKNTVPKKLINEEAIALRDYIEKVEADYIKYILEDNNNNIEQSSEVLGISSPTLYAKVKKFGL